MIAEVLGIIDITSTFGLGKLLRIQDKLTTKPGDSNFKADCEKAEVEIDAEGSRALMQSMMQATALPKPREYKIKRVAKGQRIKIVSASGVRYSFGPVWMESIVACKGLVLSDHNREKLNMHGEHVGIKNSNKMAPRELCIAIAETMKSE